MCVMEIGSSLCTSAGVKMAISGRYDKEGGVITRVSVPASCIPKAEAIGQVGVLGSKPPMKSMLDGLLVVSEERSREEVNSVNSGHVNSGMDPDTQQSTTGGATHRYHVHHCCSSASPSDCYLSLLTSY